MRTADAVAACCGWWSVATGVRANDVERKTGAVAGDRYRQRGHWSAELMAVAATVAAAACWRAPLEHAAGCRESCRRRRRCRRDTASALLRWNHLAS